MMAASPRAERFAAARCVVGLAALVATGRLPQRRGRSGFGRTRSARLRSEPHSPSKRAAPRSRRRRREEHQDRPAPRTAGRQERATGTASATRTTRRDSRGRTSPAPTRPRRRWQAGPATATNSRSMDRRTACRFSPLAESYRSRAMRGWRWTASSGSSRSMVCGKKTVCWPARTGSTSSAHR